MLSIRCWIFSFDSPVSLSTVCTYQCLARESRAGFSASEAVCALFHQPCASTIWSSASPGSRSSLTARAFRSRSLPRARFGRPSDHSPLRKHRYRPTTRLASGSFGRLSSSTSALATCAYAALSLSTSSISAAIFCASGSCRLTFAAAWAVCARPAAIANRSCAAASRSNLAAVSAISRWRPSASPAACCESASIAALSRSTSTS